MVATAIALAKERGATVEAVFVIRVPLEHAARRASCPSEEERPSASLAEARAARRGARGRGRHAITIRARSIGEAIVDEAASAAPT